MNHFRRSAPACECPPVAAPFTTSRVLGGLGLSGRHWPTVVFCYESGWYSDGAWQPTMTNFWALLCQTTFHPFALDCDERDRFNYSCPFSGPLVTVGSGWIVDLKMWAFLSMQWSYHGTCACNGAPAPASYCHSSLPLYDCCGCPCSAPSR